MSLFNRDDENKTRPLSAFQEEPTATPPGAGEPVSPALTGELVPAADSTSEAAKPADLMSVGGGEFSPTAPASLAGSAIDVEARLKSLARQIAGSKRKFVSSVLAIGESLAEAQTLLASHHNGAFGRWVKQSCGFTRQSAYRYIAIWQTFRRCNIMLQRRFDVTAMHLLAHDSTPESAVSEAIELASNGENVTTKTAREIIAKHAPKTASRIPGRPEPIILEDSQAVVVIRPTVEGVEAYDVLARILRKMMVERKAREAA